MRGMVIMKRDIQGKFALKNDDYRQVRSLRLTDETWKALGVASECLGLSRADYLESIVKNNFPPRNTPREVSDLPSITSGFSSESPSITRYEEELQSLKAQVHNLQIDNLKLLDSSAFNFIHDIAGLESICNRILFELKLGRQASGYKTAQKALARMIVELKLLASSL
jgi:hypothetical protein